MPGNGLKVLDHYLRLLRNVVGVKAHETGEREGSLFSFDVGVFFTGLQQLEIGRIGRVILEHIEDEAFVDRLAHRVAMDRQAIAPEDRERLVLGSGGESEEAQVGLSAALGHAAE